MGLFLDQSQPTILKLRIPYGPLRPHTPAIRTPISSTAATEPILMSLGAKSIATDPTNTMRVRMAGVWGRKGAYGAHIFNIVGLL